MASAQNEAALGGAATTSEQRAFASDISEGYSSMTRALRRDPFALHNLLRANHKDVSRRLRAARVSGNLDGAKVLSAALARLEDALEVTVAKLQAAGDEEVTGEEEEEATDAETADADADAEESGDDVEEVAETEDSADEEEDLDLDEDVPATNPAPMAARLRRDMGDLAADVLDEYAGQIHAKVMKIFGQILEKHLTLGDEDETGSDTLRAILAEEVGKRGVEATEPFFDEWREGVVKKLLKDLKDEYTPVAEADNGADADPDPDEAEAQLPVTVDPEQQAEDEAAAAEKKAGKKKAEPAAATAPAAPVAAAASATVALHPAARRIVAGIADFRPSGSPKTTKLA